VQVLSPDTGGEYTHQRSRAYWQSEEDGETPGKRLTSSPDATRHISGVSVQCLTVLEMDQASNIQSQGPMLGGALALDLSNV